MWGSHVACKKHLAKTILKSNSAAFWLTSHKLQWTKRMQLFVKESSAFYSIIPPVLFCFFFLNFYRSDYIIEKEPLVNRFISVPSDGGKVTNIIDWSVWQQFDWFQMGKLHIGQKYTPLCVCSVFTKQCTLHYWFVFDIP